MDEDQAKFYLTISAGLSDHPEWLPIALQAVASGMTRALHDATERAAKCDLAMRSALALADPKRLSKDAKQMLAQSIVSLIGGGASDIEKRAVERLRAP